MLNWLQSYKKKPKKQGSWPHHQNQVRKEPRTIQEQENKVRRMKKLVRRQEKGLMEASQI